MFVIKANTPEEFQRQLVAALETLLERQRSQSLSMRKIKDLATNNARVNQLRDTISFVQSIDILPEDSK